MTTDVTEKLANEAPASDIQGLSSQQPTASADDASRQHTKRTDYIFDGFKNRTKGESKFNFRTYVGLGYFGSLAASIGLTFLLRDSKWIWPKYQKLTDFVTHNSIKLTERLKGKPLSETALRSFTEKVDSNMTILSMFTATTLMAIVPIKWREDKKAEIVKQYDEQYYGKDRVENDPYLTHAHALIDAEPKQTWKSVIGSRIVAFGATMGVAALIGSNASPLAKKYGASIDKISTKGGRALDSLLRPSQREYIQSVTAKTPNELARAAQPSDRLLSRLYSYLALDGLYTVMTSSVLFVFTRVLAPFFDKDLKSREITHKAGEHEPRGAKTPVPAIDNGPRRDVPESPQNSSTPATKVQHFSHLERVTAHAPQAELTT